MRRRYIHNTPVEQQYRIRNRFSYRDIPIQEENSAGIPSITISSRDCRQNNTRTSTEDDNGMEFQYNYEHDDDMNSQFSYEYGDMDEYDDMDSQYNYYEYDDMDFDSYEESIHSQDDRCEKSDEEVEEEEEEEEERRQIVDEALNEDKMPSCNNDSELAPYFENFTAASFFCWLQKHNISTSAYEDLADIIHNSEFNPTHIVKNV